MSLLIIAFMTFLRALSAMLGRAVGLCRFSAPW
jgi:hypothetical protein